MIPSFRLKTKLDRGIRKSSTDTWRWNEPRLEFDGPVDGATLGSTDGAGDGAGDGPLLGSMLGALEGASVGLGVGGWGPGCMLSGTLC